MNLSETLQYRWRQATEALLALDPRERLLLGIASGILALLVLLLVWWSRGRRRHRKKIRRSPTDPGTLRMDIPGSLSPDSLQGGLRHLAMPDLLQFLAQGRRTGTLEIKSGRREGLVRLVQGMVVHAEFRRVQDLDALFEMLSLDTGDFVFNPSTPPDYPVSGREVVDILMLWLARKDSTR